MNMKRLLMIVSTMLCAINILAQQNYLSGLSKIDSSKRDEYLTKIAKDVTNTFGPEFYRDSIAPEISDLMIFKSGTSDLPEIKGNDSRKYYCVKFTTTEPLEFDYTSRVDIWEDNGQPKAIYFGTGIGVHFLKKSYEEWLNQGITKEDQIQYHLIKTQDNPFKN